MLLKPLSEYNSRGIIMILKLHPANGLLRAGSPGYTD
jgi:hypothetical protein